MTPEFPCLRRMPVTDLKPADYNPRTVTPESLARLKKSMTELGNLSPITWNIRTRNVIGGHQRLKVLLAAGEPETDVWVVDLPPEKEKAANLTLNNLAGQWDEAALTDLLRELQMGENDILDLTGFSPEEIGKMLADVIPPGEFPAVDENLPVEHRCPKCGYVWSGAA